MGIGWGIEGVGHGAGGGAGAFMFGLQSGMLRCMESSLLSRITIEPGKCGGKPCIRGQRMRVSDVLDLLAAGATYEEILRDYAFLEREDILASLAYAARQTDHIVLQST